MILDGQNAIFLKQNLQGIDGFKFNKQNIIIGENGSGKSRFLKAIKDYFISRDDYRVMYVDFANMPHAPAVNEDSTDDTPPEKSNFLDTLLFNGDEACFSDFARHMSANGVSVLEALQSVTRHQRINLDNVATARELEEKAQELFQNLLGRKCDFSRKAVYISSRAGEGGLAGEYPEKLQIEDALRDMSPGERALFYLSLFVLSVIHVNEARTNQKKLVLILDEPEGHLHPKAVNIFLQYIQTNREHFESCWIATHSIFALPQFEFEEIVYIHNGRIHRRGSVMYEKIYKAIVGEGDLLSQFLYDLGMWQYFQYITGCICLPEGKEEANPKDEQFLKFLKYVRETVDWNGKLTVLDYGGGKGRLGRTIELLSENGDAYLDKRLSYTIYDKYEKKPPELDCDHWSDLDQLLYSGMKFDCIVLMNTLHEIDIIEWFPNLQAIERLLADDGYLLLCEAKRLSVGEQPHGGCGFLLLNGPQVDKLFDTEGVPSVKLGDESKEKTNLFIIHKSMLGRVSATSIYRALTSLRDSLYATLKAQFDEKLRTASEKEEERPYAISREYGFNSQLYLNTVFAIERYRGHFSAGSDHTDWGGILSDTARAVEMAGKLNAAGNSLFRTESYAGAAFEYSKAIELDPDNGLYYYNRSVSYNWLKEYKKAVADNTKAIDIGPAKADYYNGRGVSYSWLMEFEKAVDDYTKAINTGPAKAVYFDNRSKSYNALGEPEKAAADTLKAKEFTPE